jgi:hypothetical protein
VQHMMLQHLNMLQHFNIVRLLGYGSAKRARMIVKSKLLKMNVPDFDHLITGDRGLLDNRKEDLKSIDGTPNRVC